MVQNRFSDNDPYAQTQQTLTADNNQSAFNAAILENDYLRSTSAFFGAQSLTRVVSNPVPEVTVAGSDTIGAALGNIGQAGTVGQQNRENAENAGDEGGCFWENTVVSLWREPFSTEKRDISFAELYARFHHLKPPGLQDRLAYIPWEKAPFPIRTFSFDETGSVVAGTILDVTRRLAHDLLLVTFQDSYRFWTSGVVGEHRYLTPQNGYVSIKELLGKPMLAEEKWQMPIVAAMDEMHFPNGIYVYNLSVETYQNYVADGMRVHNIKPAKSLVAEN